MKRHDRKKKIPIPSFVRTVCQLDSIFGVEKAFIILLKWCEKYVFVKPQFSIFIRVINGCKSYC